MDIEEIIAMAAAIEGWMDEKELEWLARTAGSRETIVEVGSWKGRSTKALALATPGVVFAIDHWEGSESRRTSTHREAVELGPERFFGIFKENMADEIRRGKVVPIREESGVAVGLLKRLFMTRGLADMVFIDAEHTYESISKDLTNYSQLLGSGGMLCGHDYSEAFPGVMKAVEDLVPGWKIGSGSIWYSVKP